MSRGGRIEMKKGWCHRCISLATVGKITAAVNTAAITESECTSHTMAK